MSGFSWLEAGGGVKLAVVGEFQTGDKLKEKILTLEDMRWLSFDAGDGFSLFVWMALVHLSPKGGRVTADQNKVALSDLFYNRMKRLCPDVSGLFQDDKHHSFMYEEEVTNTTTLIISAMSAFGPTDALYIIKAPREEMSLVMILSNNVYFFGLVQVMFLRVL